MQTQSRGWLRRAVGAGRKRVNGWTIASSIGAAAVLLPLLYVMAGLVRPPGESWDAVKQYLLTDYLLGSVRLAASTGLLAAALGVALAWLVCGYDFPLRPFFRWALVLPLAVPPYIAAYTYSTMTGYTGVIQATLRNHFDIRLAPGTIDVMSLRGAIFVLTLFLYPYVFLIARAFLERHSAAYIENARLLGRSGPSLFVGVVLPLARPALIAGAMLVVFEVLGDYGVASYFGVQTLSTAIFQTWFSMYDVDSAMRLAAWLMIVMAGAFIAERLLRANRKFHAAGGGRPLRPQRLRGWRAAGASLLCLLVFLLSFLAPLLQLIVWAVRTYGDVPRADFALLARSSLSGAAIATAVILALALLTAGAARMIPSPWAYALSRLMTVGYSVPGAVVAIGVLAVFIALDGWLSPLYGRLGHGEGALVLSLSLAMLVAGYVVRFMATGYNAIDAGYDKIPRAYTEAARTLGRRPLAAFVRVELPLLRGAVLTATVMTFVEIVKELPLTLLLRPFNFDTLATRTYQYAIDERIYEAALPSLALIGLGLISVLLMSGIDKETMK